MASVFQTLAPSCVRHGTRIEGASSSNSFLACTSSAGTMTSLKSMPNAGRRCVTRKAEKTSHAATQRRSRAAYVGRRARRSVSAVARAVKCAGISQSAWVW